MVLVAQGIHGLPEPFMTDSRQLLLAGQLLQRFAFPDGGIVINEVDHFGLQHKKAPVDHATIAFGFFLESGYFVGLDIQCAEAAGRVGGGKGG